MTDPITLLIEVLMTVTAVLIVTIIWMGLNKKE